MGPLDHYDLGDTNVIYLIKLTYITTCPPPSLYLGIVDTTL